jgi:hypothetical protein
MAVGVMHAASIYPGVASASPSQPLDDAWSGGKICASTTLVLALLGTGSLVDPSGPR